jgi:hypothetical protein
VSIHVYMLRRQHIETKERLKSQSVPESFYPEHSRPTVSLLTLHPVLSISHSESPPPWESRLMMHISSQHYHPPSLAPGYDRSLLAELMTLGVSSPWRDSERGNTASSCIAFLRYTSSPYHPSAHITCTQIIIDKHESLPVPNVEDHSPLEES